MAKRKNTGNNMAIATEAVPASRNYNELFGKIEGLSGLDKRNFCKGLSLEEKKAYVAHLRERDMQHVTGIFRSFEPLGSMLEMTAMAYDIETPIKYQFYDGVEYTVPKYIAKRFENEFQGLGTWYPTHSHILDASGKPTVSVGKKNRRFGFSSMEFQ
jgi:hypothetical protein